MRIEIPGKPIPLQRARTFKNMFYDPQLIAKKNFAKYVRNQLPNFYPISDPIKIKIEFLFQVPKSWSKKKKILFQNQPHILKKDLDNLIKFCNDSLNDVIWVDDSQIYSIIAEKRWFSEDKTILEFSCLTTQQCLNK